MYYILHYCQLIKTPSCDLTVSNPGLKIDWSFFEKDLRTTKNIFALIAPIPSQVSDLKHDEMCTVKVNNRNTGTISETCSKLTIKTPGRRY